MALIPSNSERVPYGVPQCSPFNSVVYRGGDEIDGFVPRWSLVDEIVDWLMDDNGDYLIAWGL